MDGASLAQLFNDLIKGSALKRTRKYLLRGGIAIIAVLFVFWIAMYAFFIIKKETIRQQLSTEIGNAVHGEFQVKDLGMNFFNLFPNVSLSLRGVELRDSAWTTHHRSLLKANKILLKINPFTLLSGNVRISKLVIEDAVITLFADGSGYTNEYLFSPKSKSSNNKKKGFHLDEIALKNVRFIKQDEIKNKLYDLSFRKLKCELNDHGEQTELEIKLDGTIHSLAFNLAKGSYAREKSIKGDFECAFETAKKQLSFKNIKLTIDKHPFIFSGLFDFSELKDFHLAIRANKIDYKKALTILPEKISRKLSVYDLQSMTDLNVDIAGKMQFGNLPNVNVNAKIPLSNINTPAGDFTETSFNANFTNSVIDSIPYADENSMLTFTDLKGKFEGIGIIAKKATIHNLANPFLRTDLRAETSLLSLNQLLTSASFDFLSGQVAAEITYAGALMSDTTTSMTGFLNISNGSMIYQPRRVKLENINGRLVFENEDVFIKDLHAQAQGNKVTINAAVKNMLNLFAKDPSKLFVDADIVTPSLDLFAFKTMLGTRKKKVASMKGKFSRFAEKIDHFMDDCSISSRLHAGQVKYKNFVATDLDAAFSLNANQWNLQKIFLRNSDGAFNISGTLTAISDDNNAVQVDAHIDKVNVSKFFAAFDNFGMPSLHAENIKGILTSKAHINAVLDDQTGLIASSLKGGMDLSIVNGELINFEPLQKMAVFVLKKRDFTKVEFAEIQNTFEIAGQLLTINKMEIQSTILGLYVEGIYDLKGKNTDLVVQVPLKYLKKREPGYEPENQGLDAKTGISVFVRAKNADNGEIDFKYGLFKKKSVLEKAERDREKDAKKATEPLIPER